MLAIAKVIETHPDGSALLERWQSRERLTCRNCPAKLHAWVLVRWEADIVLEFLYWGAT